MKRIVAAYVANEAIDAFSAVITLEQAAAADFNLSPSRFVVRPNGEAETTELPEAIRAFEEADRAAIAASQSVTTIVAQLRRLKESS